MKTTNDIFENTYRKMQRNREFIVPSVIKSKISGYHWQYIPDRYNPHYDLKNKNKEVVATVIKVKGKGREKVKWIAEIDGVSQGSFFNFARDGMLRIEYTLLRKVE